MLRDRYARRRLFTFVVLVVLSVGMIAVSGTRPVNEVRNGVRFAIAPVQDVLSDGTRTVTAAELTFTPDQLRCVLALAEPRLRDPSVVDLPTNRAAAARLGWKLTKFNRKLDNVCTKVGNAGVAGLHGDLGALATRRRERLVEFAVASQVVTAHDLGLLDPDD